MTEPVRAYLLPDGRIAHPIPARPDVWLLVDSRGGSVTAFGELTDDAKPLAVSGHDEPKHYGGLLKLLQQAKQERDTFREVASELGAVVQAACDELGIHHDTSVTEVVAAIRALRGAAP